MYHSRFTVHGINCCCVSLLHNMTSDLQCGACKVTDTISSQAIKVDIAHLTSSHWVWDRSSSWLLPWLSSKCLAIEQGHSHQIWSGWATCVNTQQLGWFWWHALRKFRCSNINCFQDHCLTKAMARRHMSTYMDIKFIYTHCITRH